MTFAANSHPGRVRSGNEDCLITDARLGLFAVADGLGGHQGGEVASRIAIDSMVGFVRASGSDSSITWPDGFDPASSYEANQLRGAVLAANRQILHQARLQPEHEGMGSTIIALIAKADRATFACVGDSRLYRWRSGVLTQLSDDDTWIASLVRAGASPDSFRAHQMRHMLTKALGSVLGLEVTPKETSFDAGDLFVLCSDGLYGPIGDDGISRELTAAGNDLDAAVSRLIDAANDAGGPDNVTAILVRHDPVA